MKTIRNGMLASVVVLASAIALAQGGAGAGPGTGPGAGPRMSGAGPVADAPGTGAGPTQRAAVQAGARWGSDFTPGWALMTSTERNEHRDRLRAKKNLAECQAYMAQHHEQMAARAKERNQPLPKPRRDACANLRP